MKKVVILLVLLFSFCLVFSGTSLSQDYESNFGSTYDWQSGSQYNWHRDSLGNTHVRGFNYNTGSTWNTTIEPDGDMRGWDKDMNYWQYNRGTGMYYNYGTGEMRFRGQSLD